MGISGAGALTEASFRPETWRSHRRCSITRSWGSSIRLGKAATTGSATVDMYVGTCEAVRQRTVGLEAAAIQRQAECCTIASMDRHCCVRD